VALASERNLLGRDHNSLLSVIERPLASA